MRGNVPTILLISQTISLPARRRSWQQARALQYAGWNVRVLCPRAAGQRRQETLEGIEITRFAQPFEGNGKVGVIIEYVLAALILTIHLIAARIRSPIDVVQVVNPPDWVVIPALLLRPLGTQIVLDMADDSTALFEAKFGRDKLLLPALGWLNKVALRQPDLVVAANETYRRIASARGKRSKGKTVSIQSYPERVQLMHSRAPGPPRIGYFGVLGSHDGVDRLIEATARIKYAAPFQLIIIGAGPALPSLRRLAARLGLADVRFAGFLSGEAREQMIASLDIAVIADPANRYTHSISMNKGFAYAAHGLAIVSTPLRETKRMLPFALFARNDGVAAIAECLQRLLLDEPLRQKMGQAAREWARAKFDWSAESARYVEAINELAPKILAPANGVPAA